VAEVCGAWIEVGRELTNPFWGSSPELVDALFLIGKSNQRRMLSENLHQRPFISVRVLKLVQNDKRMSRTNYCGKTGSAAEQFCRLASKEIEVKKSLLAKKPFLLHSLCCRIGPAVHQAHRGLRWRE